MIKLSFQDKCWLVANIQKVLTAPALFILLMTYIVLITYAEGRNYFEFIGVVGILTLIFPAYLSIKYANKITKFAGENFNEVVSRQTRYRKSNVELHEIRYRYMIETFTYSFIGLFAPVFSIVWIIGFLIGN